MIVDSPHHNLPGRCQLAFLIAFGVALLSGQVSARAHSQGGGGNPPQPALAPIPEIHYAVIDLGNGVMPDGQKVDKIALGSDGRVAFSWQKDTDYQVAKWKDGQFTDGSPKSTAKQICFAVYTGRTSPGYGVSPAIPPDSYTDPYTIFQNDEHFGERLLNANGDVAQSAIEVTPSPSSPAGGPYIDYSSSNFAIWTFGTQHTDERTSAEQVDNSNNGWGGLIDWAEIFLDNGTVLGTNGWDGTFPSLTSENISGTRQWIYYKSDFPGTIGIETDQDPVKSSENGGGIAISWVIWDSFTNSPYQGGVAILDLQGGKIELPTTSGADATKAGTVQAINDSKEFLLAKHESDAFLYYEVANGSASSDGELKDMLDKAYTDQIRLGPKDDISDAWMVTLNNSGKLLFHMDDLEQIDSRTSSWIGHYFISDKNPAPAEGDPNPPPKRSLEKLILPDGWDISLLPKITDDNVMAGYVRKTKDDKGHDIPVANQVERPGLLLPIEVKVTNRDDLSKAWSDHQVQDTSDTVYAGETAGDMVEWTVGVVPSGWLAGTWTWTVTDSSGNAATDNQGAPVKGPNAVGADHWQISDQGNDPGNNTSLNWKPDTYTIKCVISLPGKSPITFQFKQKVGWRTEDYLIIGQIVSTSSCDIGAPGSDSPAFRDAILNDVTPLCDLGGAGVINQLLEYAPIADSSFGLLEFGIWMGEPHAITPQGPFNSSCPLGLGRVTEPERFYMLQNALNKSIDLPIAPSQIAKNDVDPIENHEGYRIFLRSQKRFTLTKDGKIDKGSIKSIEKETHAGPTKMDLVPAGIFAPLWNNPAIGSFTLSPELNPNNGQKTSADGTSISQYASARVGDGGQNVNWRIFGKDVPWVWVEVIDKINSDGRVESSIKTSTDITWTESDGIQYGKHPFNNLNIYKGVVQTPTDGPSAVTFKQQKVSPLQMEGQIEPFVDSVPEGLWPNPPPQPSVK